MDSSATIDETKMIAVRSSMVESFRGCGLFGIRIDKDELKKQLTMPQYLRYASAIPFAFRTPPPVSPATSTAPTATIPPLRHVSWSSSSTPAAVVATAWLSSSTPVTLVATALLSRRDSSNS